jgi:hypothetical protein
VRRWRATTAKLAVAIAAAAVFLGVGAASALAVAVTAVPPGGATEGAPISGTVATFTDGFALLGCPPPSAYSAQINWGDGATTAGTVSGGVGSLLNGCFYAVAGNHAYPEEGSFSYTVTVTGSSGSGSSPPTTLVVHDARLSATGAGFNASTNMAVAATVANFTDGNAAAAVGDFSASIAWGDGTSTAGTVVTAPGGGFAVTGSHTYLHTGTFTVAVTINDVGGSQASVSATAKVLAGSTIPPASVTPPGGSAPPPAQLRLGLGTPQLARGGTVVVSIRCPVAAKLCRGRLTVTTVASPHSKLPTLRRAQTLGRTLFIIPGGRKAQLSVRPKQTVVAVLRRAGSVRVSAVASSFDSTGRSQVAKLTAKLKLVR